MSGGQPEVDDWGSWLLAQYDQTWVAGVRPFVLAPKPLKESARIGEGVRTGLLDIPGSFADSVGAFEV